eukprot:scaffold17139_cov123-Isochrysis_galbana.AAC.5
MHVPLLRSMSCAPRDARAAAALIAVQIGAMHPVAKLCRQRVLRFALPATVPLRKRLRQVVARH